MQRSTRPDPARKPPQTKAEGEPAAHARKDEPPENPVWQSLALRAVPAQPKRAGASPADPFEEEADRVAADAAAGRAPAVGGPSGGDGGGEPVRRVEGASAPSAVALPEGHVRGLGPGRPLDAGTRASLEPRVGRDLGAVRVHDGAAAAESARAVDALAYASGRDVVMGRGYAPGTADGRRLLAHEVAHVAQQGATSRGLAQRAAAAVRFQDEPTLDEVSDGLKVLKEGDKGEAVIRVTTAMAELGHYPDPIPIDESFDPPLTSALVKYQAAKGLGAAVAGAVDQPTFKAMDADFSASHQVERDVLKKVTGATMAVGTQSLTAEEKKAANRAINTEPPVNPITGLPPVFKPKIGSKDYEKRLRKIVEAEIRSQYRSMGKGKAAAHAKAGGLYDWPLIEAIAVESQKAVDGVFGEYTKGRVAPPKPLKAGTNIFDAWEDKEKQQTAGGAAWEDDARDWRVSKILAGDEKVSALDEEHGALQSRAPEKAIADKIKAEMIRKYPTALLQTHLGWPGYADTDAGQIFIQRFKAAKAVERRTDMWGYYQTFIHEYIHTLEDGAYKTYRQGLAEQKGGFTLREGATEYFTKIVWDSVTITDPLRKTIEGPFHDPLVKTPIPPLNAYPEADNAERLAGVVGVRNLAAAFFLGKVELIGKP